MGTADRQVPVSFSGVVGQGNWAWNIGLYLGLSSTGAGAYAAWQALSLLDPSFASGARVGAAIGIAMVMFGALFILFDLGRSWRFYRAASRPMASWASRAFLIIVGISLLGCVQIYAWTQGWMWAAALSGPLLILALILLMYGAILLRGMRSFALWNQPLQMVLYPASGLLAGCGVLALDPLAALSADQVRLLALSIVVMAAVSALLLAFVVLRTRAVGHAGVASAEALVAGAQAKIFWIATVGLGLALPIVLALSVISDWGGALALRLAGAATVLGLVALRYSFLVAAHRPTGVTFRGSGPWGIAR